MKAQIELPMPMVRNFSQPARHRVFKGGRGSGKTRGLALMSAIYGYKLAEEGRSGVILASREHLNSLDESSLEEIKAAIRSKDWLNDYYEIGEKYVRTKNRRIAYAFAGLRHNLDSIKSKARILLNWTDEAENVSEVAWRKLLPTIREEGSENWVSYNPESPDSATHKRFVKDPPSNCVVTDLNWQDNPWFPDVLNQERLDDLRLRPDTYDHVWGGEFLIRTEAQVFRHYRVDEFEPALEWNGPYFGHDFGWVDPSATVETYIHQNRLYIRREHGGSNIKTEVLPGLIQKAFPGIERHVIRCDNARPETINYFTRHGLPRATAASKWQGSVEDGVDHLRSYEEIIIHPDCPETAREFRLYSYKTDRLTGDVLDKLVDENNHYIDAIRYAIDPIIRQASAPRVRTL